MNKPSHFLIAFTIISFSSSLFASDFMSRVKNSNKGMMNYSWFQDKVRAGDWSSGGGNAIVCFKNDTIPKLIQADPTHWLKDEYISKIKSVEAFDLYQAKLPRGIDSIKPDIISLAKNETPYDYVLKIKNRFQNTLPYISSIIQNGQEKLSEENIIIEPNGLLPIDDTQAVGQIDKERCVLATMAVQVNWTNSDEYQLHLDERLFNHPTHSELSKAILLLHEYI